MTLGVQRPLGRPIVLVAGALAALALGAPAAASAVTNAYARDVAARESAAKHEAAALLATLQLPAGSAAAAAEPAGDGGSLARAPLGTGPARANAVDEHAWWIVPGASANVLAYVHEHLPNGARWRSGRYAPHAVSAHEVAVLKWPEGRGVLGERLLTLKVAQLAGPQTAVRADAEVLWLTPAVQVPRGARLVRITATVLGPFRQIVRELTLRSAGQIAAFARMLNSARAARPSFLPTHCAARFGSVLLRFYRRDGDPSMASAKAESGGCRTLALDVPGHLPVTRQTPPQLLRELEPELGLAFP